LSRLEKGASYPGLEIIAKLATVLEVEPAELLRVLRLPDGCADLVFMSMVYHHLTDPSAGALECRRVLRKGGYVCIRNGTRESDFPHRHFFPALRALIDSDLPSRREIEAVFAVGGFATVEHQVVTQITAPDWPRFIEKSALRADSFLARLSDDDFRKGMAALRNPATRSTRAPPSAKKSIGSYFAGRGDERADRCFWPWCAPSGERARSPELHRQ
jgi:SAM-dependent methyltransferase